MSGLSIWKLFLGGSSLGIGILGVSSIFLEFVTPKEELQTSKEQEATISESKMTSKDIQESEKIETVQSNSEAVQTIEIKTGNEGMEGKIEPQEEELPPQCFIYEVKVPTRKRDGSRVIEEILRKIEEDKDVFLKTGKGWKSSTFKAQINKACPTNIKESKNVYVWLEGGSWQYSEKLQKPDWLHENHVRKPENLKTSRIN